MAALSDYVTGTITLTNGSANFTGAATGWLLAGFKEGDTIIDVTGATEYMGVVASISANGAGTLTKPWEGPTLTNVAYRMRYQPDGARVSAQARNLIELLGNGNLQALAGQSGSANMVPMFTGPGAMTLVEKSEFGSGDVVGPSASVNNRIALFDGLTGKVLKDSGKTLAELITTFGPAIQAMNDLSPSAGSFIRFNGPTAAAMQAIVGAISGGSIVEVGVNANGTYMRLAGGVQIIHKTLTGLGPVDQTWGTFFQSSGINADAPAAAFSAPPLVFGSAYRPGGGKAIFMTNGPSTPTSLGEFILGQSAVVPFADFVVTIFAIGWA